MSAAAPTIAGLIRHALTGRHDGTTVARLDVQTKAHGYIVHFLTDLDAPQMHDHYRQVRAEAYSTARRALNEFEGDAEAGWPTIAVEPIDPTNPHVGILVDVTWRR